MKKVCLFSIAFFTVIGTVTSCKGNDSNKASDTGADKSIITENEFDEVDDSYDPAEESEEIPPVVHVSEDGAVTIETAMYPTMATAPDYWSRWKFKNKEGKDCEVFRAESPFVEDVFPIKKDDGSTYYITSCFGRASRSDGYLWLEAYKLVGDTIEEVNVVNGERKDETADGDFGIEFCIPNNYYVPFGDSEQWTYKYNPETGEFYVPIISGPSFFESYATDRYILWRFNGREFENVGDMPNKDLNSALSEYVQLFKYFETPDYIVRVDSIYSDGLRYASWKKPKTMRDEPDMVLKGGCRKVYSVPTNQVQPCDEYYFKNGDYQYIVNQCQIGQDEDGNTVHHDFLVINKDGKTIMKQESNN